MQPAAASNPAKKSAHRARMFFSNDRIDRPVAGEAWGYTWPMATEILMPELGESVHEGTVSKWLKQVGDTVEVDEPIVEIMTDKVNQELPSPAAGTLVKILIEEGDDVEVFHAMGIIEEDAAKAAEAIKNGGGDAPAEAAPEKAEAAPEPEAPTASSGPAKTDASGQRKFYTPVVRVMAKENGVSDAELESIQGTGASGRVTKKDLEKYLAGDRSAAKKPKSSAPAPQPLAGDETKKLSGMRKFIAEAMERSHEIPTVSTLIDVDVTPMVEYRKRNKDAFQEQHGVKLTYTPFFIKALTECLIEFPDLNASFHDGKVTRHALVNMGIAVSLGEDGSGGLIVPVIRDCHSKSIVDISRDLMEIASKARNNELENEDVQGGTFTLTNPGTYGAVLGTPMIVSPQAAILGAYGIKETVVAHNGMIGIRQIMNAVLTYDHRLVDGLSAGRFLQALKQKLEDFDFLK